MTHQQESRRERRIRQKALWFTITLQLLLIIGVLYGADLAEWIRELPFLAGDQPPLPPVP